MGKSLYFKMLCSAIAGFLIAAAFVVVPGTIFMRPSRREGQPQQILSRYHELKRASFGKNQQSDLLAEELIWKAFWLCVAQNEVDCLPFLVCCASVGPAIILLRSRNKNDNMRVSLKPNIQIELKPEPQNLPMEEKLEHVDISSAQPVEVSLKELNLQD